MRTNGRRFDYAATLFHPGGTVTPPAGKPAPAFPPIESIPDGWTACAALRHDRHPYGSADRVPVGMTRVIFCDFSRGHAISPPALRAAFDFPSDDCRRVCGGPSCDGRTIADFRNVPATPARPEFYY
jgi:hypothetical protein